MKLLSRRVMKKIIEILKKLVSFDTSIERSTLDAAYFVANFFDSQKLPVQLFYKNHNGIYNNNRASVIASVGKGDHADLLLSGHLDTYGVSQQIQNWKTNPFNLTRDGQTLFGRGVVDMKGSIAVALSLIPFFIKQKLSVNFVFTHDEEGGFSSINQLKDNNFYGLVSQKTNYGIVMEPTDSQIKIRHKGYRRYKVCFNGVLENQKEKVWWLFKKNIELLHKRCSWKKSKKFEDNCSSLTLRNNMINEEVTFQYRYEINDLGEREFEKFLPIVFNRFCEETKIINKNISCTLKEEINILPLDCNHPFFQNISDKPIVSYGTEAGYFQKYGIPTVIIGAGNYSFAHRSNECIQIDELKMFKQRLMSITRQRF